MGQWLTLPLMALGLLIIARALSKPPLASGRPLTA
jgi:phosphatidylglycerol:prolipoprotein diacylglycerol transferase